MAYSLNDVRNLLSVLKTGNLNKQTATQIESLLHIQFNFPISGNQQNTRALLKYAVSNGHLIKSTSKGFWLSNDKQEITSNIESLKNRGCKIIESAVHLKDTWNALYPNDII